MLALSLLAVFPLAALRVARRIGEVVLLAGEDSRVAHARVLGAAAADALDSIRRTIPPNGEFLLLDGGAEWQGATYWVRFELAPRRARYAGRLSEIAEAGKNWSLPAGPRWVVIAFPHDPTILLDRDDFLRRMDAKHGSL